MELASADLAALGTAELVRVSAWIPRAAPRTFAMLTACLVFPLSIAVLAHSLFTHPILLRIDPWLVQSMFYYSGKSFHNQQIDRTVLSEHLGGYLGEYMPLKSDIQMENLWECLEHRKDKGKLAAHLIAS